MGQENPHGGSNGNNDNAPKKEGGGRLVIGKLWVPIVIFVGTIIGIISYVIATEISGFPHFNRIGQPFGPNVLLEFHIILSTVGMALLVALIVVYARTYLQTKANFILGLLVFLFALLLQAVLTYPVLIELEIARGFAIEVFSPVADVFTIVAYAVFLYLSLE
jgi:hypothetical protein